MIMNHNHQFTGDYDFLLAGEPPYRQLVCCMVSVLSSALAHTILYSPWVIYFLCIATVYKGNIIKNLIMDCQSYTKYRPNETTGGIFVSWRRKEELPTGA